MNELKSRRTGIRQIIDVGNGYLVLENSFRYPPDESNLYKVDYDFKPVWDAEIRKTGMGTDHYANFVFIKDDGSLLCAGAIGDTYTLNPNNGKIISKEYTK